jgi:hypothetical protein
MRSVLVIVGLHANHHDVKKRRSSVQLKVKMRIVNAFTSHLGNRRGRELILTISSRLFLKTTRLFFKTRAGNHDFDLM